MTTNFEDFELRLDLEVDYDYVPSTKPYWKDEQEYPGEGPEIILRHIYVFANKGKPQVSTIDILPFLRQQDIEEIQNQCLEKENI